MKPSLNQLIFCTAMLVSAATRAQEVTVANTTNTTYTVTVVSADTSATHTFTLPGRSESTSMIPLGSIRGIKAVDAVDKENDSKVFDNTCKEQVRNCPNHRFEIKEAAPGESTNIEFYTGLKHIQNTSTFPQPYILHMVSFD